MSNKYMTKIFHAFSSRLYHTGLITIGEMLLSSDTVTVSHENYTYA